ncbi:MAG: glycosyltransferase family 2 protein [Gemmatimonadaceae bacterium]
MKASNVIDSARSSTTAGPALSVVVVPFGGLENLDRCLSALEAQVNATATEIVVPWPESFHSQHAIAERFPDVLFVGPATSDGHPALRALGCRSATGQIIALTEAQCTPDVGWCAAILGAHSRLTGVVGGVVEKDDADSAAEWAVYLADYGRYMKPAAEGPAASLSDVNVSYKREALMAVQATWVEAFHENAVHEALRERGGSLWLSPMLVVRHRRAVRIVPLLRERFQHARMYATARAANAGMATRMALASGSVILPALLILRVAVVVTRKRRHIGRFFGALPSLAGMAVAWSCGELVGYVTRNPGTPSPLSGSSA